MNTYMDIDIEFNIRKPLYGLIVRKMTDRRYQLSGEEMKL